MLLTSSTRSGDDTCRTHVVVEPLSCRRTPHAGAITVLGMPWFPDFVAAAELARRRTRTAAHADPVAQYFTALTGGDARALEAVWPGEVVIYDPRAGEVRGHRQLRRFVRDNQAWLGERDARTEIVASTCAGQRAVVELQAHLTHDGEVVSWPLAVVAESRDDRSVVFRTYCSQWPVDGRRHVRPAILQPRPIHPREVVGRYQAALAGGDVDAIVSTFAPDGYLCEPTGADRVHRGTAELRTLFSTWFSAGGGVRLQTCAVTDDDVRCALEYNCDRWGRHELPPQAGITVFERAPDGLLAGARVYDDVEAPVGPS
jgi:ketosteroid isomerase-like protein